MPVVVCSRPGPDGPDPRGERAVKILTILGTRPEIIRLSRIIPKLDRLCTHVLVHTGQNFDPALSDLFFRELEVRAPDRTLGIRGDRFGERIGRILAETERVLLEERPDRVLVLGDTDSGLSAFVAKRMGIPVYHLEAGNRCFDDRVPEEVNRRVIDHASDVWMPYTERSRQNLLREGIPGDRVFVVGNPIGEVLRRREPQIRASRIHASLGITPGRYLLVTLHRAENVDVESRLRDFARALDLARRAHDAPVIVSTHPRTRARLEQHGVGAADPGVRFLAPFGFFDFVALERDATCVLTDSGTVQEECAILGVPTVTLRDVTERPETLECGSNMLSGCDPETVLACIRAVLDGRPQWKPPAEYLVDAVSDTVAKVVLGYRRP